MSSAYNVGKERVANDTLGWEDGGKDFVAVAVTSAYTFDANHANLDDVVGNELSGTGTRAPVENRSVNNNTTEDRAELLADDSVFPSIDTTEDIGFVVVAEEGADDANSPLVGFLSAIEGDDTASFDLATNGANITIAWPSGRVARVE